MADGDEPKYDPFGRRAENPYRPAPWPRDIIAPEDLPVMRETAAVVLSWWQKTPVLLTVFTVFVAMAGAVVSQITTAQTFRTGVENRIVGLENGSIERRTQIKELQTAINSINLALETNRTDHAYISKSLDSIADKLGVIR